MKAYKDIQYGYTIFTVLGIIVIGALVPVLGIKDVSLIAILIVGWAIGNAAYWMNKVKLRDEKIKGLMDECAVEEYISECEIYERKNKRYHDALSQNDIRLNLASGYYAAGRYDDMFRILNEVELRGKTSVQDLTQEVIYHTDMALCHAEKDGIEEAEKELAQAIKVLDNIKFKEPQLSRAVAICNNTGNIIKLKKGELEGLEEVFKKTLSGSAPPITKVSSSYYLGDIYSKMGKPEDAAKFYDFAIKYGGDSIYAKNAVPKLKEAKAGRY